MSENQRLTLKNSLASTQMEGFTITEEVENNCVRLLQGEISVEALVTEILNEPSQQTVSSEM